MNAYDIANYILCYVPTFQNVKILPPGHAYHYTNHADAIEARGTFLGAPLNRDLDKTQMSVVSQPATADPGVVFAYSNLSDAIEEGFGAEIFEVVYASAVSALHSQEAELGAPPTILISTSELLHFFRLGPAKILGSNQ